MIRIHGAREHNLRAVDVTLPLNALVVFCGVSGSGKSSLAFDTLHAEGQRRYLEALSLGRAGPVALPAAVDAVHGLPPTIALAQRASLPSRRSTVGSLLDIDPVLRILVSRAGRLHCPRCGRPVVPHTHDEIVAAVLDHEPGTRITLESRLPETHPGVVEEVERAGFSRLRIDDDVVRLDEVKPSALARAAEVRIVVDRIKVDPERRSRVADSVRLAAQAGGGVLIVNAPSGEQVFVDRPYCWHDELRLPDLEPALLSPHQPLGWCEACEGLGVDERGETCSSCGGARLSEAARAVQWRGLTFPELQQMAVQELIERLTDLPDPVEVEAISAADLLPRLRHLPGLRMAHLPLERRAQHLSSSERQRLRLLRQVANPLAGVLYVLDEPAAGLDADLVDVVVRLLRELVELGNSVVAVEHHGAAVRAAEHVVEFGPGAGRDGGQVVYQGAVAGLLEASTPTGRWMSGADSIAPADPPPSRGTVRLSGPWLHGRKEPLTLPRGQVVAITGPSSSGKTTALEVLGQALAGAALPPGVVVKGLDGLSRQATVERAAARTGRSMPATYVGLWDVIRPLLAATREARIRGFTASTFSLNTKGGRCDACKGAGDRRVDMGPLPDIVQKCAVCDGRRFEADVLEVRWKGLDPAALLALEASEARVAMAGHPDLDRILGALVRVGLGYVPLGQAASSLSGGEAMRLALARELARAEKRGATDTAYLLDDPSVGLHPADTAHLVGLLRDLTEEGATVWLATSDPSLAAASHTMVTLPSPMESTGDSCGDKGS